jgi:glycosyltransferase involved in cell wall biosynthesis
VKGRIAVSLSLMPHDSVELAGSSLAAPSSSGIRTEHNDPLVSVLIANYNYRRYLPGAIDSVLGQTYRNYELIVCDDGSEDGSRELIDEYATRYPDVVLPLMKENGGVASALNTAYAASKGAMICFLDADDLFAPEKLRLVVEAFSANPRAGLVANQMVKFGDSGTISGLIPQFGHLDRGWIRDELLRTGGHWSFAPTSGISLRRACAEEIFPIPEDLFRSEADVFINTQAPLRWEVALINQPVTYYRLHSSNLTSSQEITPLHARRIISGLERMCDALTESARQQDLPPLLKIADNPVYQEMSFVRDYLEKAGHRAVARDLTAYWRAAYRSRTGDRQKLRIKPFVLTAVAVLPRTWGVRVLKGMYLPTRLRRAIAARLLRRRG